VTGKERGRLVLVATPIGNLEDLAPRAVRTLAEADVVAAEDTRPNALLQELGHPGCDIGECRIQVSS
jgi:16S rRNA (cytidine1402-2'-O)-methyltransferase